VTFCSNQNHNKTTLQKTLVKGENLISRIIIVLDSNVQFSIKKNHKAYKETGKYSPRRKSRSTETVCFRMNA
jgi:hypothetical protein